MWALTPEKVRCRAQGDELCNISYRCLTDSSGGQRKGRRRGQIGQVMALKDWKPVCHSPQALISAQGVLKEEKLPPLSHI